MEAAYAAADVERFAAWVEEGDTGMRQELERRGYAMDTSTLAMGMSLVEMAPAPVPAGVRSGGDAGGVPRVDGLPISFLTAAAHAALHVLVAREDGEILAVALAYDFAGDCGIYNVGTRESARRRGLGTALTAAQVRAARERGCRTAGLQSTPMGEGVYRAAGFRALRRILEIRRDSRTLVTRVSRRTGRGGGKTRSLDIPAGLGMRRTQPGFPPLRASRHRRLVPAAML